ncbi:MAG TPA: DNA gyrase inhibitor YacG [Rubrivivax sp.]|nr:DNA gyrase inhibitor YacG [Rubrivivax sp.]
MSAGTPKRERRVRCPACGKQTLYSPDNPARPFCSMRCRSVDLGAWASESYRVASGASDTAGDDQTPPRDTAH